MPTPIDGAMAPDFTLPTASGEDFTLSKHRGSWVVLYFYAEDDTEGCTIENQEFTALLPEFGASGAVVAGVSEDSVAKHCRFRDKYNLPGILIADPDHVAIEAFGVWGPKVTFGHHLIGLLRSTFLIDPEGRVATQWRVTRIKGHAAKVLEALKKASAKAG
jgi:thioredoxin-dependent peroxiredoxin